MPRLSVSTKLLLPTVIYALTDHLTETTARLPFTIANFTALFALFLLGWRLFGPVAGWSAATGAAGALGGESPGVAALAGEAHAVRKAVPEVAPLDGEVGHADGGDLTPRHQREALTPQPPLPVRGRGGDIGHLRPSPPEGEGLGVRGNEVSSCGRSKARGQEAGGRGG